MKHVYLSAVAALCTFAPLVLSQGTVDPSALLQQLQEQLPPCALNCMLTEIPKSSCALTDVACICTNTDLSSALLACLAPNCTVVEQLETQRFQVTTCGAPTRDIGSTVGAIMWTFFAIAIIAVVCRGIARLPSMGGSFSWDDYTIFACLLALVPAVVFGQLMIDNGLGRDIWMLTTDEITNMLFYFYIELYLYCFLVTFTKLSILLLYLRIFTARSFQWRCYVLIAVVSLMGLTSIIVLPVACRPLNFMWKGWQGTIQAKCIDVNAETFAYAAINMSLDIIIFLLPISQVLHLQMGFKKKIGVTFMFAIGLIVTICSIIRLPTILKWGRTVNPTYDYARLAILSLLEMMFGIICACFPGLAGLLRRSWPKVFGTTKASKGSGASYEFKGGKLGSGSNSKQIFSKTTVSVAREPLPDSDSARSDELELTPHTAYRQHENYTRFSLDSDRRNGHC